MLGNRILIRNFFVIAGERVTSINYSCTIFPTILRALHNSQSKTSKLDKAALQPALG